MVNLVMCILPQLKKILSLKKKKKNLIPDWCSSKGWASSHKPRGH